MSKKKDMNLFILLLSWTVSKKSYTGNLNVMYVGKDSKNPPIGIDTMKLFIIKKRNTSAIFVKKFLDGQTILQGTNKFITNMNLRTVIQMKNQVMTKIVVAGKNIPVISLVMEIFLIMMIIVLI